MTELQQVLKNQDKHKEALKAFKECYEGLQIGSYSDEVLQDVANNGINNIATKFKDTASQQLDKSGITSPLLKANLLKGCNEVLKQFELSIDGLIHSENDLNKKIEFDRITNTQMKVQGLYIMGNSTINVTNTYKSLQVGFIPKAIVTTCNKVFDIDSSNIRVVQSEDNYFIYAKLPRSNERATLVVFTEPKENTDKDFYILWQSGTFNQIKF